mgnify:CR=1 FL=1
MVQNKLPLVSVIITTYKRADMLERAVKSVLNQDYKNLEIIIVDDNDPNSEYRINTEAIMLKFLNFENIKYFKHGKNLNGSAARNTGIKNAVGEFVCFLDDDDTYRPEKVREQVEFLINNREFNAVYCGWNRDNKEVIPTISGDLTFEILSGVSLVYTNVIMMKREVALSFGGWDESFRRNQEAAFLLRYFKCGHKIGVVSKVLVDFDTSDRSNSSNPQQNEKDFDYFLLTHKEQIENCASKTPLMKSIIYSYRYRGVLLSYIKNKDLVGAIRLYIKMIKKYPVRYNADIIKYFIRRLQKKDVFS